VLPIVLIDFKVKKAELWNELKWETASEINFSHFEIEKSFDTSKFLKIGELKANLDRNERQDYNFIDENISGNATIYYRLKMVDLNGSYNYSKIISIENEQNLKFQILQNPVRNTVVIKINENLKADFDINIYDLFGKIIFSKKYDRKVDILKISTFNFAPGEFILRLSNKNATVSKRFIKE
jgi:Secretion system C-terminal sorting domain